MRRAPWRTSTGRTLAPELYDGVIIPALSMAEQDRHKGALEPVRRDFLFLSIKEMVVEFSEKAVAAERRSVGSGGRAFRNRPDFRGARE